MKVEKFIPSGIRNKYPAPGEEIGYITFNNESGEPVAGFRIKSKAMSIITNGTTNCSFCRGTGRARSVSGLGHCPECDGTGVKNPKGESTSMNYGKPSGPGFERTQFDYNGKYE